jgi:hypothetical protein
MMRLSAALTRFIGAGTGGDAVAVAPDAAGGNGIAKGFKEGVMVSSQVNINKSNQKDYRSLGVKRKELMRVVRVVSVVCCGAASNTALNARPCSQQRSFTTRSGDH